MRKLIVLAAVLLLMAVVGAFIFLKTRTNGFSARAEPTAIEVFAAQSARALALPAGARERPNPIPDSKEAIEEGMDHWADHCAICHGNDGAGQVPMGKQMYPHAPDMRTQPTQQLSDGELFYIIENGIRLSGMPAWGGGSGHVNEQASWKLVRFIRHLPALTREEVARMEKMNPQSPEDIQREQEEDRFLNEAPAAAKPNREKRK